MVIVPHMVSTHTSEYKLLDWIGWKLTLNRSLSDQLPNHLSRAVCMLVAKNNLWLCENNRLYC